MNPGMWAAVILRLIHKLHMMKKAITHIEIVRYLLLITSMSILFGGCTTHVSNQPGSFHEKPYFYTCTVSKHSPKLDWDNMELVSIVKSGIVTVKIDGEYYTATVGKRFRNSDTDYTTYILLSISPEAKSITVQAEGRAVCL